jgi:hypothetical protein
MGKIQLNPFVHPALIKPDGHLPSELLKNAAALNARHSANERELNAACIATDSLARTALKKTRNRENRGRKK